MINKVYDILKACNLPLEYNLRPDFDSKGIVLSYHVFNESVEAFEDGAEVESGGSLQVDIFAKRRVDFTAIKKQVKQLLKMNDFIGITSNDTQENVEGIGIINHVVITSNYLETEET